MEEAGVDECEIIGQVVSVTKVRGAGALPLAAVGCGGAGSLQNYWEAKQSPLAEGWVGFGWRRQDWCQG